MKKILINSTSIRSGSNSELLAQSFLKGAKEAGNDVEFITLKDKDIHFCRGCMACQKIKRCVINDSANEITEKMSNSEIIVWATPIYYYSTSGQLKTMIDRANPLFVKDNKFKEVYLLCTAAEEEKEVADGAKKIIQGWVDCFEGVEFVKTIFVGGVNEPNAIKDNQGLLEAYKLGLSIN